VIRFLSVLGAVGTTLLVWIAVSNVPTNLRVVAAGQAGNQAAPPAAAAVATGRDTFTTNCSFCHGSDARGGAEGGPDLTRSAVVATDMTGQQLVEFLKVGRPPRMPAFNLPDEQVANVMAFLRSQIAENGNGRGGDPKAILVGDAKAGEVYFNGAGKCTSCHSVTGNLKGVGSKYDPITLQGRMVLPRAHGGYPSPVQDPKFPRDAPRTVTVTQSSGQQVSGELISISDYDVTLVDSAGMRHTFARNEDIPKVVVKDPAQAHLDMLTKLTNKNMHDLTAYLVTLK